MLFLVEVGGKVFDETKWGLEFFDFDFEVRQKMWVVF